MKSNTAGALFVLAGALCFSTTGLTQALMAGDGASPLAVGAIRTLAGGLALLSLCLLRGSIPRISGWPVKNIAAACFGLIAFQLCFFKGVLQAGVAVGTLASVGFTPVSAALLSALFLKERPALVWYPSTLLILAGLWMMTGASSEGLAWQNLLFPLAAGASYAFYLTFGKALVRKNDPLSVMTILLLICGVCLCPLLYTERAVWLLTGKGLLAAVHLGVVTMAAAHTLSLAGLRRTSASTAATLATAEPVCAALLGFVCLHEPVTPVSGAGMLCIIAGSLMLVLLPDAVFNRKKTRA